MREEDPNQTGVAAGAANPYKEFDTRILSKAAPKNIAVWKEAAVIFGGCAVAFAILSFVDPFQMAFRRLALLYLNSLDHVVEALSLTLTAFIIIACRRWKAHQDQASRQLRAGEILLTMHGELEKRVQQRTSELAAANEALRSEIAERKKSEEERQKLEENYRQAQKLESIGQLAGGVAHDFNNILAVIQLQSDLIKNTSDKSSRQRDFANEIGVTVQRASALTRQLLLFSRREVFQPRDMELSDSIVNTAKILKRTLGENVQMQLKLASQPMFVHADPAMIDQILLNLSVNARDAMPKGGQLTIETCGAEFDEKSSALQPQARAGAFVCLTVSDSGSGIPPEILPRIFEPFYTTKGVGKGTGLGLATVFGVVEQHQGWVEVQSEVGFGTTFRIYFPRLVKNARVVPVASELADVRGGDETILLAEDDPALRASVRRTLSRLGYRILEAPTGVKALEVWKENRHEIGLLVTDMMMPDGMTGNILADHIHEDDPSLNVIYMSGYSADVGEKKLGLKEGLNFLAKPFPAIRLAKLIREKLDARN
jgi:signal transduction histidine kinase/ActR/RegA family two-component response regulator